jgi:hypothetical protein
VKFQARAAVLALLSVAAGSPAFAQRGSLDPAPDGRPLEQWAAGGEQARIKWSVSVSRARLSPHQRLEAEVEIRVDGAELARRRGEGQLLVLLEIDDQKGRRYPNHMTIDLAKVEEGIARQDVLWTFAVFVTPGDYRIAAALYDTATREHSLKRDRLEVAPMKNDPLPDAWRDLPDVEYVAPADPPDSWYLPSETGRLRLPLETRKPVEIEVVVNLTPSEWASRAAEVQSSNLSVLIPALKVISQLSGSGASLGIELLDLSRQRVVFRQENVRVLDWTAMRRSLAAGGAGTIDVGSLERHRKSAAFFVTEIGRIVSAQRTPGGASESQRVVIVLTGPVAFDRGVDLEPIALRPSPDCRVFYIRYHSVRPPQLDAPRPARGTPYGIERPSRRRRESSLVDLQYDQLESTLKPLAPRVFDVTTPEQFRKALAGMIAGIGGL